MDRERRLRENHILSPFGVDDDLFFNGQMALTRSIYCFREQSRVGCVPGGCSRNGPEWYFGSINFKYKGRIRPIGRAHYNCQWLITMTAS